MGRRLGVPTASRGPPGPSRQASVPILAAVEERAPGRRLAWSTAIFSLATGLSRILGLVREIVAAYYFGAAGKINAFTVAFQVPNLIRSLVADAALSSAFVPVFSELLEKGERKRAWRVASTLFWLLLLGLTAIVALLIVFAPLIIAPFGDPGGDKQLAITLSRILFPIVVLLGVSGIIVGILNSYEHFTVPALTPVFWNLAIIAGLVFGVPHADTLDAKLYVYAVSIVIGTVIQVLLPLPWLYGLDDRLRLAFDWRDPAVRRVFVLMIPVTIGLGLINFNLRRQHVVRVALHRPGARPARDRRGVPDLHAPAGDVLGRGRDRPLSAPLSARRARRTWTASGIRSRIGLRQIAFTLVPGERLHRDPRHADHADRLPARKVDGRRTRRSRRQRARRVLARADVQRRDADAEPRVLQAPDALDADGDRRRQPRVNTVLAAALYHVGTWGIPLATSLANIFGAAAMLLVSSGTAPGADRVRRHAPRLLDG